MNLKDQLESNTDVFSKDVQAGLSASPKFLSSKYFYDDEGSGCFVK